MLKWLNKYFHTKRLDDLALQELEEALIRGDVGVKTSEEIVSGIAKHYKNKDINIKVVLSSALERILSDNVGKLELIHKPHVIMMVGAKGSGKTTSVCRLAGILQSRGKKVALIAGDTSCLQTVQQLHKLASQYKMRFFYGQQRSDPAQICLDALKEAIKHKDDVVIIDTAGNLEDKHSLIDNIKKIAAVLKKVDLTAPHSKILNIDASKGQNALGEIRSFLAHLNIAGLIINKLDNTHKSGVVIAICKETGLPIYYMGTGQEMEDIAEFSPKIFVEKMLNI